MKALRPLSFMAALAVLSSPVSAQIVPVAEAGSYRIMQVESRKVCFAAAERLSNSDKPII